MQDRSPVSVVQAWHDALNQEDHESLLRLTDLNIEIVGPRGSGFGHDLLRQWLTHARVRLEPQAIHAEGATVVVAQHGTWRAPGTGEEPSSADVASVFRVREHRVIYYARYDTTDEALARAGISGGNPV